MVKMSRYAKVSFKTELVIDLQFNSMEAGKCQVYWEWNCEHEYICKCTIQDRTGHGLSV